MLTRELGISSIKDGWLVPDRLTREGDHAYLDHARRMLDVYEKGIGLQRGELHRRIERTFAFYPEVPPKRIEAFCKLLDERSEFESDRSGKSAKIRQKVFSLASQFQPIRDQAEGLYGADIPQVRKVLEEELSLTWDEIASRMWLDLPQHHKLVAFDTYADAASLLARYNVAQTQVALFDATEMVIEASRDFKGIIRYIKLAKLMHRIEVTPGGYRIRIDGPASVLQSTHRYGVAMAKLLPGLLACSGWRATALLRKGKFERLRWYLDSESGLSSEVAPVREFDSDLEATFSLDWENADTEGWTLKRESLILQRKQTIFLPDFTLHHEDGRVVYLEIVGFWTPEYLTHKCAQLTAFADTPILLIVPAKRLDTFPIPAKHSVFAYQSKIHVGKLIRGLRGED